MIVFERPSTTREKPANSGAHEQVRIAWESTKDNELGSCQKGLAEGMSEESKPNITTCAQQTTSWRSRLIDFLFDRSSPQGSSVCTRQRIRVHDPMGGGLAGTADENAHIQGSAGGLGDLELREDSSHRRRALGRSNRVTPHVTCADCRPVVQLYSSRSQVSLLYIHHFTVGLTSPLPGASFLLVGRFLIWYSSGARSECGVLFSFE
jgi:hypothetical protein